VEAFRPIVAAGDTLPFADEFKEEAFRRQWMDSDLATYVAVAASGLLGMSG
jgi:hypothetical protein